MDLSTYPPCEGCACEEPGCADHFSPGTKVQWPELVGVKAKVAMAVIRKENPLVTPYLVGTEYSLVSVVCCNRVVLKPFVSITPPPEEQESLNNKKDEDEEDNWELLEGELPY
ncbi:hypothetical protein NE237_017588 [Protea cynaroides]|uniref:Uncharacterized protein n=1 Tax=Protea cynaroides TaxID=273540 RepID=A0A9Q0K8A6_9MAGN|nr:hypothetical protein NE237_017588 [Protea cynaroides]